MVVISFCLQARPRTEQSARVVRLAVDEAHADSDVALIRLSDGARLGIA